MKINRIRLLLIAALIMVGLLGATTGTAQAQGNTPAQGFVNFTLSIEGTNYPLAINVNWTPNDRIEWKLPNEGYQHDVTVTGEAPFRAYWCLQSAAASCGGNLGQGTYLSSTGSGTSNTMTFHVPAYQGEPHYMIVELVGSGQTGAQNLPNGGTQGNQGGTTTPSTTTIGLPPGTGANDPCQGYQETGIGVTKTLSYTVPAGMAALVEGHGINGNIAAQGAAWYTVRQPGTYSDTILDGAVCVSPMVGSYPFNGTVYQDLISYRLASSRATLINVKLNPLP